MSHKYKVNEFDKDYQLVDTYHSDKPVSDILPHIWARNNQYEIWEDNRLVATSEAFSDLPYWKD